MVIQYTTRFSREYRKLPREIKELAKKQEILFRKDIFDQHLATHKLTGRLAGYWAFSINQKFRIMFAVDGENVVFVSTGDHSIYDMFR